MFIPERVCQVQAFDVTIKLMLSNFLIRDLDSENLLEIFLVSAISAILVNLFLTSFFDFYTNQFEALPGFFFNIFLLITLNFLIIIEKNQ